MNQDDLLKLLVACVAAWLLYSWWVQQSSTCPCNAKEYFQDAPTDVTDKQGMQIAKDSIIPPSRCVTDGGAFISTNMLPKQDPKMKDWSEFAPQENLQGQHMLLEPEQCIGQDTVSNHLRNASYDIRKEPPNPSNPVSPWINSTIGPDLMRRPLEDCDMFVKSAYT